MSCCGCTREHVRRALVDRLDVVDRDALSDVRLNAAAAHALRRRSAASSCRAARCDRATDVCAPSPSAIIAITAATPITMPSIVSSDRRLVRAQRGEGDLHCFESHFQSIGGGTCPGRDTRGVVRGTDLANGRGTPGVREASRVDAADHSTGPSELLWSAAEHLRNHSRYHGV